MPADPSEAGGNDAPTRSRFFQYETSAMIAFHPTATDRSGSPQPDTQRLQPGEIPPATENKFSKTADAHRDHGGATQVAKANCTREIKVFSGTTD
ncbi:hypothetical protein LJR011_003421 [Agrobacterium tumefaciens]